MAKKLYVSIKCIEKIIFNVAISIFQKYIIIVPNQ